MVRRSFPLVFSLFAIIPFSGCGGGGGGSSGQSGAPPPPRPTVTSITPNNGPQTGGTVVTVNGSHFSANSKVTFGDVPGTAVTLVSHHQLTVTSPAGTGIVDVRVTTSGERSAATSVDNFTYTATALGPPTITSISPTSGPAYGGTVVTILGTNFTPTAAVWFGGSFLGAPSGTNAPFVTFVNTGELVATTPAGWTAVTNSWTNVTTASGTSNNAAFTFLPAAGPTVTSIHPRSGPAAGGTVVTIHGTGFGPPAYSPGSTVMFGATAATSVTFISNTHLTAIAPPGSGSVNVQVTTPQPNPGGGSSFTSPTSAADTFSYAPAPLVKATLSAAEPAQNAGPAQGKSSMTATELSMVAAIRAYRQSLKLNSLSQAPNASVIGVVQWHARDMSMNNYVGLVGSDGEDYLQRLANSDPTPILNSGVIVVKQSDSVSAVLATLKADPTANAVLTLSSATAPTQHVAVGENNGCWMIFIY